MHNVLIYTLNLWDKKKKNNQIKEKENMKNRSV